MKQTLPLKLTCLTLLCAALTACYTTPGTPKATYQPAVASVSTPDSATNVFRDTGFSTDLTSETRKIGVDPASLKGNVHLYRVSDNQEVPGSANTDGAFSNITFQPDQSKLYDGLLAQNTSYTLEITSGVKDRKGNAFKPFKFTFTTGTTTEHGTRVATFSRQTVFESAKFSAFVGLTLSPDGKLYGTTLDGQIYRWPINADGTLGNVTPIYLKFTNGLPLKGPIIGMAFDPVTPGVVWLSYNDPLPYPNSPDPLEFSGKILKVTLTEGNLNASPVQEYVVGLPRSKRDHLTESLAFGPDNALYVSQGSNSSAGDYDGAWQRHEHLLNATVLRVDPNYQGALPIDVQTDLTPDGPSANPASPGNYDPTAPGAPVTIFADGVRNSFDLVWHSNGSLYMPTNGAAAGGNTPTGAGVPALQNVADQNDYLFKTSLNEDRKIYFGHPVALRGHYVLNGGNPTAGEDPAEVVTDNSSHQGYPVGTQPDPNWRPPAYDFGAHRSPDGAIEYKGGGVLGSALGGRLMVIEYANGNDIVVLKPDNTGNVPKGNAGKIGDSAGNGIMTFEDPIDLVQAGGTSGNLYVTELVPSQGQPTARITLLKPVKFIGP